MYNLRVKLASATATLGRAGLSHIDSTTPIANIAPFTSCLHLLVGFLLQLVVSTFSWNYFLAY